MLKRCFVCMYIASRQEAGRETIGKRKLATDVIYYIPTNTVFENTSQEVSCSGKIQEIFFVGLSCAVIIRMSMGMNAAANSKAAAKLSLASSWGTAANAAYRDDGLIIGCLLFFRSIDPSRASSMYLLSTCWNRWSCLSVPIQHSSVHIPAIFVGTLLNYPSKTCWDTLCYTFYVFALTNNDVFSSSASESEEWGLTSFSHNTKACIQRVSIIRSIVIHSVL